MDALSQKHFRKVHAGFHIKHYTKLTSLQLCQHTELNVTTINIKENKLENLSSPVDLQTHASSAYDNYVTQTLGSVLAKHLPRTVCLPSSVLIAQHVFLFECRHTV